MRGHRAGSDGTHFAAVGAVKGEEGFSGKRFSEAEETGVFCEGSATGENTKAERIFKTFLYLERRNLGGGVGGPIEVHKNVEKPF